MNFLTNFVMFGAKLNEQNHFHKPNIVPHCQLTNLLILILSFLLLLSYEATINFNIDNVIIHFCFISLLPYIFIALYLYCLISLLLCLFIALSLYLNISVFQNFCIPIYLYSNITVY